MNKVIRQKRIFQHFTRILMSLLLLSTMPATQAWAKDRKQACYSQCITGYGKLLGSSQNGVSAYSNCNNDCVIFNSNKHQGTYTGIKWQCVEYARRWLLINHNVVYGDVDFAIDIWDNVTFYTTVQNNQKLPVKNHLNGAAQAPVQGDLLVYARVLQGTGHVAVVLGINKQKKWLYLGEQNYSNKKWVGKFSRQVSYIVKDGRYWILDPYLIGWKHADFK